jgi:hypothetical protein
MQLCYIRTLYSLVCGVPAAETLCPISTHMELRTTKIGTNIDFSNEGTAIQNGET